MMDGPSFLPAAQLAQVVLSAATKLTPKCLIAAIASLFMVACDTKEKTSGEEPSPEAEPPPLASPPLREKPAVSAPGPTPQSDHDRKESGNTPSSH